MILSLVQMEGLAAECAPGVAVETLLSVAKVESGFDPLAVGVNGKPAITVRAKSKDEAIARASALIKAGRSVDLGVAQINSRNLQWLGLSVEAAFDPCRNLATSARVLQDGYGRGAQRHGGEQHALLTALSYYNTGHPERGFRNGYVAKVISAAQRIVPALRPEGVAPAEKPTVVEAAAAPAPAWDVFGLASESPSFVIRVSAPDRKGGQE